MSGGQNPDDLRHLVEHSANVGALDASYSASSPEPWSWTTLTVRSEVHVRDTLPVTDETPVADLMRTAYRLPAETAVYAALTQMRVASIPLALVTDGDAVMGWVS